VADVGITPILALRKCSDGLRLGGEQDHPTIHFEIDQRSSLGTVTRPGFEPGGMAHYATR